MSKLSLIWDILMGKANPLRSGCYKLDGKFYSARKGEITEAEYEEWCEAEDTIRKFQSELIKRANSKGKLSLVWKSSDLQPYRDAMTIHNKHK